MRETSLEALTQPHPLEMAARLLQRLSLQEFVQVCSCIVFHVLAAPTERLYGPEQTQADNWGMTFKATTLALQRTWLLGGIIYMSQ